MTSSSWKEQFARLGPTRTIHPVSCGSPAAFVLAIAGDLSALRTSDCFARRPACATLAGLGLRRGNDGWQT
jgi:hypothetical protein